MLKAWMGVAGLTSKSHQVRQLLVSVGGGSEVSCRPFNLVWRDDLGIHSSRKHVLGTHIRPSVILDTTYKQ